MTVHSRILGTGSYLPPRVVSNAELTELLAKDGIETSDEWIFSRSGIAARHYADASVQASDLAVEAARRALEAAHVAANDIDLIVVATSTPDMVFPSTACIIQHKLGIDNQCAAFDVQAVCSGFAYAFTLADNAIKLGQARRVLVIGTEVFSRILDFKDRTTCVLFGDGAGAVVLGESSAEGVLATRLHADGRHVGILCVPGNVHSGVISGSAFLHMDGPAVFKLAVNVLDRVAREALAAAQMTSGDIDWLIPHQANIRIMQGTCKKLGLPLAKMVVTVDRHGNTSAASIPLALDEAVRDGRIVPGQVVMMEGVGGGFTWGALLVRM
jgi:3-oxoacyl-[acyl-carrier-protein] synthase-3